MPRPDTTLSHDFLTLLIICMAGVDIRSLYIMKLNFIRLAMGVIIAATMTACGGGVDSLKPETTTVKGKLGSCFTVVDREYKLKEDSHYYHITIELERTDATLPFIYKPGNVCYYGDNSEKDGVGMGLELLDKDGDIVYKTELTSYWELNNRLENNESVVELMKLEPGETGSVEFELPADDIKGAVSFRANTVFEAAKDEEPRSSYGYSSSSGDDDVAEVVTDDDDSSTRSSSSTDWDSVLDSYDRYVTKYVAVAKKLQNGDMSVMSEYTDLMSEAQTLSDKLQNASDEMTAAQIARYSKIMAKMASAM